MSVFRRKTTLGETREFHYRFMKNGKLFFGVCDGCYDKEAAEEFEKNIRFTADELAAQRSVKALVENFRDELTGGEKILLQDSFRLAISKPRKKKIAEKHYQSREARFNDFIRFMSKEFPDIQYVNEVTYRHAEKYITLIRSSGRYSKSVKYKIPGGKTARYDQKICGLSSSTLNRYLEEIQSIFSLLQKDTGMLDNPFGGIYPVLEKQEAREAFSEKELELIMSKAPPFIHSIFMVGFFTALREGDISTLRWSDVLWEQGVIRRKLLKTGNIVEIPIMPPLMNFLREQVGKDKEYVLPEHAAMYLQNPSGVSYRVKRFLEDELGIATTRKIPGRTRAISVKDVHSLRHTFCYFAGVAGIPLVVVQSIVGHMTPEMTSHYTAHADRQTKREKMALIPHFSALVGETRRRNLVEQTRAAVIEKIATASDEVLNRIAAILLPQKPRRLLLHNKELEMPK